VVAWKIFLDATSVKRRLFCPRVSFVSFFSRKKTYVCHPLTALVTTITYTYTHV
jgi:hypothetical protein